MSDVRVRVLEALISCDLGVVDIIAVMGLAINMRDVVPYI